MIAKKARAPNTIPIMGPGFSEVGAWVSGRAEVPFVEVLVGDFMEMMLDAAPSIQLHW